MKHGDKFKVVTGQEYTIFKVNSNMIMAVDENGGVSTFSKYEVDFLVKYWKRGEQK